MLPFEAYQLYLALKQHFTSDYDFFKYRGKVNATEDSYSKRTDKTFFSRLSRSTDPQGFLVANFSDNPKATVFNLRKNEARAVYAAWKERQTNLVKTSIQQLSNLDGDLKEWLTVNNGQHPYLFKAHLKNLVDKETLLVLNCAFNFLPYWDRNIADPIVWDAKYKMLEKYQPFIMIHDDDILSIKNLTD